MTVFNEVDTHIFEIGGRHFLLDVEGARVYSLSRVAFDLATQDMADITQKDQLTFEKWKAHKEIAKAIGKITPLTDQKRSLICNELETSKKDVAGLWLGLAHRCNLDCRYCFANQPSYLGKQQLMSSDIARQAVEFMLADTPSRNNFSITFFGGEPLLNMEVIEDICSYCGKLNKEGKYFDFAITTNGTLLTPEIYKFLTRNNIAIMVSIDGSKEIHDHNRPLKNGKSSWDIIVRNLAQLPEIGRNITARATIVHTGPDLFSVYESLADMGFQNIVLGELCPNSANPSGYLMEAIPKWKDEYFRLAIQLADTAESLDEYPLADVRVYAYRLLLREKNYYCCSTGLNVFYVSPDGRLYPCFRLLTDDDRFRVGTVSTGINEQSIQMFKCNNVFNTICASCWARYLCGGQCYGDSFARNGALGAPLQSFCAMTKHRIETAAYVLEEFKSQDKLASQDGSPGNRTSSAGLKGRFRAMISRIIRGSSR